MRSRICYNSYYDVKLYKTTQNNYLRFCSVLASSLQANRVSEQSPKIAVLDLRFHQINTRSWCVFVRASLHMHREEKPTRCHCMLYCIYDMLNMFRALLCPSSGALDYMYAIAAYGVQCLAVGCRGLGAGQQGVRPGRGMLHDSVVQHPSS